MPTLRPSLIVTAVAVLALAPLAPASAHGHRHGHVPRVLHVGQIDEQDIAPQPGSEPDTLVEPDVAVSPKDPDIAVAAAHDGRFPDGGAVGISYAWTHDGGRTWHHAPVPGLTVASGGVWDRASDPVLAFGPDGSVYLSVLVFDLGCDSGVTVSRSTDGGATFGAPVLAHVSHTCDVSDDKNFLTVDTGRHSPFRGRIYQFWTPFLFDAAGNNTAALQVVRWSDDHGQTWSPTVNVTPDNTFSQNSQPMIQPDGTLVDAYLDFGTAAAGEGPESRIGDEDARQQVAPTDVPEGDTVTARTSHDGGTTWSGPSTVTTRSGEGPAGIRCCLPSSTADGKTGRLYTSWIAPDSGSVELSRSSDGAHWSAPVQVTRPEAGRDYVNVDVSAYHGKVFVASSTRDTTVEAGRFVQQQLSTSRNAGRRFGEPVSLGPLSDLNFAAFAGGTFPGDYMGCAATKGRVYTVWARSSQPDDPTAAFHQTVWGATLRP